MRAINRISFVWNADFSIASGVRALREAIEGEHSCTLCEIAYHRVRQTADWKDYKEWLRSELAAEVKEPCRNQLRPAEIDACADDFPTVLAHTNDGIEKLLTAAQIDACDGEFQAFKTQLDAAIHYLQQG